MTSQEAREALEALVENSTTGVDIMAAADTYGDTRELGGKLKGHIEACEVVGMIVGESDTVTKACGDNWYCDKAPRR